MIEFKYKPDGDALKQYMRDDDFFRGIRGPVGSGKSVGSAVELFRRALLQEPDAKGVRRTRWGVIRNTGPQLRTTTIKTWLDWFPEEDFGAFRWGTPFTHHIIRDDLDMEVIFLALDDEADVRKLLSLELTGVWANEAREMPKGIIDACTMRCGRYPSMRDGGPTWYGMIADTNAPEDDHWWPIMSGEAPLPEFISEEEALMLRKPEGWKFYTQPPGMLEKRSDDGKRIVGYEINPKAENRNNLTPDYYNKIITGKRKDWIDVYVMNRLGSVSEGKLVLPEYREETHKAPEVLEVIDGKTLYVGIDFGFTPAAIFAQQFGRGQWRIIDELCPEDISTPAFAKLVKKRISDLLPNKRTPVKIYGDPSGDNRSRDREDKKSSIKIMQSNGVKVMPAPTNDLTVRIDTVAEILNSMVDGRPRMMISPKCSYLLKGFSSGYIYRRMKVSGSERYEETPTKNKYSHPHDALQYLVLGAGEGRAMMRKHLNSGTAAKKGNAKKKWNVFGSKKRRRTRGQMNL